MLSAGFDKTARLYNALWGKQIQKLEGHTWHVNRAAFTLDGLYALTGSQDTTVRLWRLRR